MDAPPTLAQVVTALERLYPPCWARDWDAVGLVCGDPERPVRRILFAVDPVAATAEEAVRTGADLLVTHHPLFLRGTTSVAATTAKGRVVHRLVTSGVGLHVAHTNADVANPGVSDALAAAVGLTAVEPLRPDPADPIDKLVTFVPRADADRLLDALSAAGAGAIGDYGRCAYLLDGTGTFLPGEGANPTIGERGRVEWVAETRLEMVLHRSRRAAVVRALRDAHPYEEPAYDVTEVASLPGPRGLGRVGALPEPAPLREVTRRVAAALPATVWGVRAAGDPDRPVHRLAVCGGAGGDLAGAAAAAGAEALLTADLRHHPASETVQDGGVALIDAAHWATEWPWLADAATRVVDALGAQGRMVRTEVSRLVTDPWTLHEDQ